jgi:hypothetical protein
MLDCIILGLSTRMLNAEQMHFGNSKQERTLNNVVFVSRFDSKNCIQHRCMHALMHGALMHGALMHGALMHGALMDKYKGFNTNMYIQSLKLLNSICL